MRVGEISILLAKTIEHGPRMWQDSSPIIAQNFPAIVGICVVLALTAQWSFAHQFSSSNSCFWSAYLCQSVRLNDYTSFHIAATKVYIYIIGPLVGITLDVAHKRARCRPLHAHMVSSSNTIL